MNICNSFAVLSYFFRMSANKFTKELRRNYEKRTIDFRLRESYEVFAKSLRNYS